MECFKFKLNNSDNHDGKIRHLEPHILECEAKWTLGSITKNKVNGGDRIAAELFQILNAGTKGRRPGLAGGEGSAEHCLHIQDGGTGGHGFPWNKRHREAAGR